MLLRDEEFNTAEKENHLRMLDGCIAEYVWVMSHYYL